MKILVATAGLFTAVALTACGGGSSGGHSADYKQGYDIASHELVQSALGTYQAGGQSLDTAAQNACDDAYNVYQMDPTDPIDNKDDYIKGCVDAVKANPPKTTNP